MLKQPALAWVLSLLLFWAVPATAGVTGTEGDTGTEGGTKTITETRSETHTDRTTENTTEYLNPIIRDRGNHYTYTNSSVWRSVSHGRCSHWFSYDVLDRSVANVTFLRDRLELKADRVTGNRDDFLGYTHYDTRSVRTVSKSDDLIVIGDPDYLEAAYVAQGHISENTHITDDYWDNYRHVTIRQKDYDLWHDYHQHNTNYYSHHYASSVTPIVLNLDGSGKFSASNGQWLPHEKFHSDQVALFDFNGNGQEVLMEWISPSDGLLCVPNPDGSVDGTCLFGSAEGFEDGYQKLALRDLNLDGKLTGQELDGLCVWQDRNSNGIAGSAELIRVSDLGITEISVKHDNFKSTFVLDGKTHVMWDWSPNTLLLRRESLQS